jgi:hypothetical protein
MFATSSIKLADMPWWGHFVLMAAALQRIVDVVNSLLIQAEAKRNIVSVSEEIIDVLKESGYAVMQWLPPDTVAVHEQNRDSYGVNPTDCHTLMREIKSLGWSWSQVKAIAVELSSDEERAKTYAFNHKLSEGSLGLLPPAAACEKLKAASLTAGHTNTGLRCIRGQVACSILEISVEGRMNATRIAEADAAFGKAISDGLHWLVISSKIAHGCPGLVQLLQAAGNAPAQIQKYENEVQVLLRIHNAAKVNKTEDGHIDWEAVKRTVNRSKPPCHADAPFLMHFVSRKAGSLDEAFLLQDLENFHKMHVPTDRVVKGGFFESLASFELSPTNLAPFWTLAMLKSQYSCPPSKVKSGECKYISSGDVKCSSGLWKDDVAKAESMLQQCRQMLQQHFVVLSKKTELLGKLDVRMVCLVMNKLEQKHQAFDTM